MRNADFGMRNERRTQLPPNNLNKESPMSSFRIPNSAFRIGLSRRDALRLAAAGMSARSLTGWLPVLAARDGEPKLPAKAKACIVLWMDGGPPHTDTFD